MEKLEKSVRTEEAIVQCPDKGCTGSGFGTLVNMKVSRQKRRPCPRLNFQDPDSEQPLYRQGTPNPGLVLGDA